MPDQMSVLLKLLQLGEKAVLALYEEGGGLHVVLSEGGHNVTLTIQEHDFEPHELESSAPPLLDWMYETQPHWSLSDLRERGLPLYWNRDWLLRARFEHRQQPEQFYLLYPAYSPAVIRQYMEIHGIKQVVAEMVELTAAENPQFNQTEVASLLNLGKGTVSKRLGSFQANVRNTPELQAVIHKCLRQGSDNAEVRACVRANTDDHRTDDRLDTLINRLRKGESPGETG